MADRSTPTHLAPMPSTGQDAAALRPVLHGVAGWLLLLCLMLTAIGPLITTGLLVQHHLGWPPSLAPARSLPALAQVLALVSVLVEAGSLLVGIRAGLGLWSLRPGAVGAAKTALLLGLAASAVTVTLQWVAGSPADAGLLHTINLRLLPDLVFFTAAYAYLNKSARVQATYPG